MCKYLISLQLVWPTCKLHAYIYICVCVCVSCCLNLAARHPSTPCLAQSGQKKRAMFNAMSQSVSVQFFCFSSSLDDGKHLKHIAWRLYYWSREMVETTFSTTISIIFYHSFFVCGGELYILFRFVRQVLKLGWSSIMSTPDVDHWGGVLYHFFVSNHHRLSPLRGNHLVN